ncbi:hypothetical protein V8F33_011116 [Rhypophila sp. PSN 637]
MSNSSKVTSPKDIKVDYVELDDNEFEVHLKHFGVEQPDNFTGPDRLRDKGVVLCGRLTEAAHGVMARDSPATTRSTHSDNPVTKDPCSLIVFEWYVHTTKPNCRIKFARIDVGFKAKHEEGSTSGDQRQIEGKYDPWVQDCAPWGAYSLLETDKTLEKTKGWSPTLKLGVEGIPLSGELPYVYELKETVQRKEHLFVDGCPLPPLARKDGKPGYSHPDRFSTVQWNLFENAGQESGIPRYFWTCVLVNRSEMVRGLGKDAKFEAEIVIKVRVSVFEDTVERVRAFLGRAVKDDDLVFNPALLPKTNRFDRRLGDLGPGGVKLLDEMAFVLFKTPGTTKAEEIDGSEQVIDAEENQ